MWWLFGRLPHTGLRTFGAVLFAAFYTFAGMNLNFDVTVREVRQATPEELEHGHLPYIVVIVDELAEEFAEEEREHVRLIEEWMAKYPAPEEGWDEDDREEEDPEEEDPEDGGC